MLIMLRMLLLMCAPSERPSEEPGWSRLQLTVVILVPSCLLCVGILLGVCVVQGHHCACGRAHKQDPEEPLDDQMLMSPDKCLKELIFDMSTSGSGSGERSPISSQWGSYSILPNVFMQPEISGCFLIAITNLSVSCFILYAYFMWKEQHKLLYICEVCGKRREGFLNYFATK